MSEHGKTCCCVRCLPLREYQVDEHALASYPARRHRERLAKLLRLVEYRDERLTAGCSPASNMHLRQERDAILWALERLGVVKRGPKPRRADAA